GAGQGLGLDLLKLQVFGVVHDVVGGGGQVGAVVQGDQALGLQQQQGAALVGGVVGDADDGAVRQLIQRGGLAGVDAHGLDVDAGHAHQMGAPGLVELLQIGQVLEVVGVLVPVLHGGVGHHIVAVLV